MDQKLCTTQNLRTDSAQSCQQSYDCQRLQDNAPPYKVAKYVKIFSQHAHNIQFAEWSSMSSAKSGSRPAAFTCAFSSFLALNIGSCCLLQNAVYPNSKLISTISTRQDHLAELQAQPFAQSTRTFTIQFVRQVNTESVEKLEKTVCLT